MTRRDLRNRNPSFTCAPAAPAAPKPSRSVWAAFIGYTLTIAACVAIALAAAHYFGA